MAVAVRQEVRTIVLVDDDAVVARTITDALGSSGSRVLHAATGREGERCWLAPRFYMARPLTATISILVVEDDTAVAELLRAQLNDVPGWGATVVHDAAAARAVFRHVRVEALVVDVNLPGISGLELLHLLEADPGWHDPPVVLVSAEPSQPGVAEALAGGRALRMVAKPFDVDALIGAMHEAVNTC